MHHTSVAHNQLPALADLGTDLLLTTPRQRRVALLRPFIGVLAYVLAAYFDLEHHLYPQVPSHHLAELARGLDPFFEQAGVRVWHVL